MLKATQNMVDYKLGAQTFPLSALANIAPARDQEHAFTLNTHV